jgi:PAS domain S-box-containing protein
MSLGWVVESLAMHTDDAVLITEAEPIGLPGPRIVYCNEAFSRITGYKSQEVVGQTPRILQGPDTDPAHRQVLRDALATWTPIRQEILNYRKDGTPFWVDLSLRPVADEAGFFRYWVGVQRDTTESRAHTAALERALEIANAANEAKLRFIATLNHEIRTPMNGVMGMAALMADDDLPDAQRARLNILRESCGQLMSMIDNVLDFAKDQEGMLPHTAAPFDLRRLCEGVVDLCRGHAGTKPVVVRLDWCASLPPRVVGDEVRVRQVLLNLLGNAAKFTDRGAVTLSVDATPVDGADHLRLAFIVRDTGPGIPSAHLEKIFDPFTQADQSPTRAHGGTGLGLPISRSIARRMGGDVTVSSQEGKGSVFTFTGKMRAAT